MNPAAYLTVLLLSLLIKDVASAKIMAIMLVPSTSHVLWYTKYLDGLLRRGHSITFVGCDKIKIEHPNLRQVIFDKLYDDLFQKEYFVQFANAGPVETTLILDKWDNAVSTYIKKSEKFQQFLKMVKTESFDLVVQDIAECIFMLGALNFMKDASVIAVTPFGRPVWALELLKTPLLYPSFPHNLLPYQDEMTFFQRVNSFFYHWFNWGTRTLYMIEQNKHAKDAFGEDIEPLEKILDRMNIIVVNSNPGLDYPCPAVPGLVQVGGLHIDPPKELPKDLKMYLDNATDGVIYVSFGTNILSSNFGKEKVEEMLGAFKELAPVKVLWKWDGGDIPGKPDNVKLIKWAPQNDILAHPKTRLFLTHSGLLSTQETVYHGVPIVGMPFFLDQRTNLNLCVHRGIGEGIVFNELSKELILEKMRKVLGDRKYKENAKRLSMQFRDLMQEPLERSLFWTEYAIRHKGAPHLSLQARKMAWYENAQLDVYLFLLIAVLDALFIALKILQCLGRRLRKEETKIKTS